MQRRLKQLRKLNVVDTEVAGLNHGALGQKMTFVIMIELERQSGHQLNAFQLVMLKEERVQQCYFVAGQTNFTLICTARDMQDFEDLTHSLLITNPNVKWFRTSVVMERTKSQT